MPSDGYTNVWGLNLMVVRHCQKWQMKRCKPENPKQIPVVLKMDYSTWKVN